MKRQQDDDTAGPSEVKKKKAAQKKKKSPKRKKTPKKKKTPVKKKQQKASPHHSLELSRACHSSLIPNSLLKSLIPES